MVFEGDFTGVGVNYVTINQTVKLTANNATFTNVEFDIFANDVVLDGFNLYMDNANTALITIGDADNVTISNNVIDYKALDDTNSFAVFANNVSNLRLRYNTITYVGNTGGTSVNNAVRIEGDKDSKTSSKNITVWGNTFDISIPSVDVSYDPTTWIPTPYAEGIVFSFCDYLFFEKNTVTLNYNNASGFYDTINVVSVRDIAFEYDDDYNAVYPYLSSNSIIYNNTITALGHNYIYGVYVSGDIFVVEHNVINVTSDYNYANGISVDGPATNGYVYSNTIAVTAPNAVYGIYSYPFYGATENITYSLNEIEANAYVACGMEIVASNPVITSNNITAIGNYTAGIVASISEEAYITENSVMVNGTNVGTDVTGDSLIPQNSIAISIKGNATIAENNILSTGIGINLVEEGAVTLNYNNIYVVTRNLVESYAIYAEVSDLEISDNMILFFGNTDGTVVNNAIRVTGDEDNENPAENITVKNNLVGISIPSVDVGYDMITYEPTVYSEGIVFYYCEDLEFINNNVYLIYNNVTTSYGYDTIYVVSVRSNAYNYEFDDDYNLIYPIVSSGFVISNNTITANGHSYIYGVYVSGEFFNVSSNTITITSNNSYANGINVDGPASFGDVNDNNITVTAPNAAYGIYSYQYMGSIDDMDYFENIIDVNAYAACGMEIVENTPYISDNTITANGNYTTGIVASVKDEGEINGNIIAVNGTNVGTDATGDALLPQNSIAISVKGDTSIKNNIIYSTAVGVNLVEDGEIVLSNNTIEVQATGTTNNYALYASNIEALLVTENAVYFVGSTNGTAVSNAVLVTGTEGAIIDDNTFDLSLVSIDVTWVEEPAGSYNYVKYPVSEGIVIKDSKDAILQGNYIEVDYNDVVTAYGYDTIYVIDADNSNNTVISENSIAANGNSYIYGIIITSANFTIYDNTINIYSNNYANGINPDAGASGVVDNNDINAIADNFAYPIYSNMYGDLTDFNVNYTNNKIYGDAYYVVALGLGGASENVINNTISAIGNYTIGIGSNSQNNTISNNIIGLLGTGEGNESGYYDFGLVNTGIVILTANATISDNYIEVSNGDYAVDLGGTDSTVENSYVAAKKTVGTNAIVNAGSNAVISNITPSYKVILAAVDLYTVYDSGDMYYVKALDENGDPIANITLIATLDDQIFIETTDSDGVASFYFENITVGDYNVAVTFYGNDVYGPKSITGYVSVEPRVSEFSVSSTVTVLLTAVKSGSYYKVTLKDDRDNGIANATVTITFNGKTANYTTNDLGVIKYKLSASATGTKTLKMVFNSDSNYVEATATAKIKITKQATKLTAKAKTFKAKTKTKKYAVVLKDSKGKAIKKVKVTIKVNGKTYKAKTNSKGKATFKITKLTKKATFKAKVKFAGNKYYKAVSKTIKIKTK